MNNNYRQGEIFEKYIASLYESLNYTVSTNISFCGQQVDILAKKTIQGAGETNLIIECKFLSNGNVSNQVIHDFSAFINSINKPIYRGVLITNRGFSKDAKSAVANNNIILLTQEQLESEILHFKEPYFKNIKDFEKEDIFSEYIPLLGIINKRSETINIEDAIVNYTYEDWKKISFITILADYGAGKTTLLKRLNYLFSKKYLEGNNIKPIFFELKNFHKYVDLDSFILNRFIKVFQKELPIDLIWKGIEEGSFLFLLDGFDEMSPQTNTDIRNENFTKLAPLLLSNSNTIITCRPSYFISKTEYINSITNLLRNNTPPKIGGGQKGNYEYRGLQGSIYKKLVAKYSDNISIQTESKKIGAQNYTITISDFSDTQIDTYLKKFDENFKSQCHSSWIKIKDFLIGIYDIKSLLKKPILLSMIKDTMLKLGQNYDMNNELYDPASLYEIYTNANIDRDWSKGQTRQFLSSEQRLSFAETLAHQMFIQDNLEVQYSEITTLIKRNISLFSNISNYSIEEIASDIQICSFMKRTEDDTFRFIHKSFMEFFVAKKLKREFYKKEKNELYTKLIPKDILYFLGCYSTAENNLQRRFAELASPKSAIKTNIILRRNTTIAYLLSRAEHLHLNIKNIILNLISLDNITFRHCEFDNLRFDNVTISAIKFTNGTNINILVKDSIFNNLIFDDHSVVKVSLQSTDISDTQFDNCREIYIESERIKSNKTSIINCAKVLFNVTKRNTIERSTINNSSLNMNSPNIIIDITKIKFSNIHIQSSNISISHSVITDSSFLLKKTIKSTDRKNNINFSIEKTNVRDTIFKSIGKIKMYEIDSNFKNCNFQIVVVSKAKKKTIEDILKRFENCRGLIILGESLEEYNKYQRCGNLIIVQGALESGFIKSIIYK